MGSGQLRMHYIHTHKLIQTAGIPAAQINFMGWNPVEALKTFFGLKFAIA